jgi:hypothetical protein
VKGGVRKIAARQPINAPKIAKITIWLQIMPRHPNTSATPNRKAGRYAIVEVLGLLQPDPSTIPKTATPTNTTIRIRKSRNRRTRPKRPAIRLINRYFTGNLLMQWPGRGLCRRGRAKPHTATVEQLSLGEAHGLQNFKRRGGAGHRYFVDRASAGAHNSMHCCQPQSPPLRAGRPMEEKPTISSVERSAWITSG